MSVRKLTLGTREVTIEFERKRIRNINVRVRRDGTLYCSLPYYASVKEAESFIISKQDYLLKSLDSVIQDEKTKSLSRQYVDGEVFTVLGKPYVLKVLESSKNQCRAEDGIITLEVTDTSNYRTKYMTYEKWRRRCIKSVIVDLCNEMYPLFERRGVAMPKKITLGEYKSFWGECFSKRGELKFSYRLFEKDRAIIRYVVVHEFAHFIEPNHSSRFWAIVAEIVPDYKELRKSLNSNKKS
ncbi:MAG: M48 family metallopeptidase [Clostridiales bacterium]|nr:M48 family metallopeptidase [Clostridiales bacterium]